MNDEMWESGCKTRSGLFVSVASGMESAAWRAYGSVYRNGLLFEETRRSEAAREAKPSPLRQTSSECGSEPTNTNKLIHSTHFYYYRLIPPWMFGKWEIPQSEGSCKALRQGESAQNQSDPNRSPPSEGKLQITGEKRKTETGRRPEIMLFLLLS